MPSASQSLSREAAPLDQRGRASPFVNLAGHEMTLLVEMIVDLSEITTVPSNQETTGTLAVDGAAGDSKGEHEFRDVVGGKVISGFSFGRDLWPERLRPHKTIIRQSLVAILPGQGLSIPCKC